MSTTKKQAAINNLLNRIKNTSNPEEQLKLVKGLYRYRHFIDIHSLDGHAGEMLRQYAKGERQRLETKLNEWDKEAREIIEKTITDPRIKEAALDNKNIRKQYLETYDEIHQEPTPNNKKPERHRASTRTQNNKPQKTFDYLMGRVWQFCLAAIIFLPLAGIFYLVKYLSFSDDDPRGLSFHIGFLVASIIYGATFIPPMRMSKRASSNKEKILTFVVFTAALFSSLIWYPLNDIITN